MQDIGLFLYYYFSNYTELFIYDINEYWRDEGNYFQRVLIKELDPREMLGHPLVVSDTEVTAWRV